MTPVQRMQRSDAATQNACQRWRNDNWGTLVPRGWLKHWGAHEELVPIRGQLMDEVRRRVREEIR